MKAAIFLITPWISACASLSTAPDITDCENISNTEEKTIFILSADKICDTKLSLTPDGHYVFSVESISDDWADGDRHDALRRPSLSESGWTASQLPWYLRGVIIAQPFRRCSDGRWFEIIGEVLDSSDTSIKYRLGEGMSNKKVLHYKGTANNRLILYANDLNSRYHNNFGKMTISVQQVRNNAMKNRPQVLVCK